MWSCAAETLANSHGCLADGGFLLLYETTAAFTTCLWGLDERTWKFTDEREYGLWMAKPRWHRLWTEAGFTQVVEHWYVPLRITHPSYHAPIHHQSFLINVKLSCHVTLHYPYLLRPPVMHVKTLADSPLWDHLDTVRTQLPASS